MHSSRCLVVLRNQDIIQTNAAPTNVVQTNPMRNIETIHKDGKNDVFVYYAYFSHIKTTM